MPAYTVMAVSLIFLTVKKLKGMLAKMGFGLTDKPEDAGLVIFNTCAVRENAEDRVFGNLGFLKHYKEKKSGDDNRSLRLYDRS